MSPYMNGSLSGSLWALLMLLILFAKQAECRRLEDSTLGLSEIDWHLEKEHIYLGSPSLLRYQKQLIASHDYFGSGVDFSIPSDYKVSVFGSDDEGVTWAFLANVSNMYWANLFEHEDDLYLMGTGSDGMGTGKNISNVVLSKSIDGGRTWSYATPLFRGPYHTAPTPTLVKQIDGQPHLFRAMEYWKPPGLYGIDFLAIIVSCNLAECGNLTDSKCWTISEPLAFNTSWTPLGWGKLTSPSWQEGNAVETPDGKGVVNILRFNGPPAINKAVMLDFDGVTGKLTFRQFISFPGGHTKFTIRRHPTTKTYWTLSNNVTDPKYGGMRNILTLSHSEDLVTWNVCHRRVLEDDTGFEFADSVRFTGFHYVDWQFDGPDVADIIYAIRTGYRGANTFHNANRLTYKLMKDFTKFCALSSSLL